MSGAYIRAHGGHAELEIDGVGIDGSIVEYGIEHKAGYFPVLTLRMVVLELDGGLDPLRLTVSEELSVLLERNGWTRPRDDRPTA